MKKSTMLLAVAVAASMLLPARAFADTYVGGSGVVGQNMLRDSATEPGVTCVYDAAVSTATQYDGRLVRLRVRPPIMRAASGRQEVGWRFIVDRVRQDDATRSTAVTYASPWQVAIATTTRNARFSARSVGVRVPRDAEPGVVGYGYTVRIDMIWDAIGAPTGESIRRADNYRLVFHDYPFYPFEAVDPYCHGIYRVVQP